MGMNKAVKMKGKLKSKFTYMKNIKQYVSNSKMITRSKQADR